MDRYPMVKIRIIGFMLIFLASAASILYILWFFALIPWADPELAVRIPVLLLTLFAFFIVGFIGYVMLATKPPKPMGK
jgi:predicted DNA-binding transcriptional regulator